MTDADATPAPTMTGANMPAVNEEEKPTEAPAAGQPTNQEKQPTEEKASSPSAADPAPKTTSSEAPEEPDKEGSKEDDAAAIEDDDTWYGDGPSEGIEEIVRKALGAPVTALFIKAVRQLNGAGDHVARVLTATATFVSALNDVPESMQMTGAFGELSLAYGRALLRYVELEGTGSTAVVGKIVKALQGAAPTGRAPGGGDGGDEDSEDTGDEDDGEDDTGKDGDEEEDLQSAWTQLEVARVIFSREGWKEREAECRATIGELLMACDEGKQAGEEFEIGAGLFTEARRKAECYYKRYLALRNGDRGEATASLREAVKIYEGVEGSIDVLEDMKAELADIAAATAEAGGLAGASGDGKEQAVQVVSVRPKRKRDVLAEQQGDGKDSGNGDGAKAKTNGAAGEETNGKKARTEKVVEATGGQTGSV